MKLHADSVLLAPELYRCLTAPLDDGRVHGEARGLICRAVAYFVLPEEVHGGEGFLDDVYFALWTLDRLRDKLPEHVLKDAWEAESRLAAMVDEKLPNVGRMLGSGKRGSHGPWKGGQ